jgi:hypothetical protein
MATDINHEKAGLASAMLVIPVLAVGFAVQDT